MGCKNRTVPCKTVIYLNLSNEERQGGAGAGVPLTIGNLILEYESDELEKSVLTCASPRTSHRAPCPRQVEVAKDSNFGPQIYEVNDSLPSASRTHLLSTYEDESIYYVQDIALVRKAFMIKI